MIIASDRRIMLDETQSIPLEESDSRAAYLLVGEGCPIDTARLTELGMTVVDNKLILPDSSAPADVPETIEDDLTGLKFGDLKAMATGLGLTVKVGSSAHVVRELIRAKRKEEPAV